MVTQLGVIRPEPLPTDWTRNDGTSARALEVGMEVRYSTGQTGHVIAVGPGGATVEMRPEAVEVNGHEFFRRGRREQISLYSAVEYRAAVNAGRTRTKEKTMAQKTNGKKAASAKAGTTKAARGASTKAARATAPKTDDSSKLKNHPAFGVTLRGLCLALGAKGFTRNEMKAVVATINPKFPEVRGPGYWWWQGKNLEMPKGEIPTLDAATLEKIRKITEKVAPAKKEKSDAAAEKAAKRAVAAAKKAVAAKTEKANGRAASKKAVSKKAAPKRAAPKPAPKSNGKKDALAAVVEKASQPVAADPTAK